MSPVQAVARRLAAHRTPGVGGGAHLAVVDRPEKQRARRWTVRRSTVLSISVFMGLLALAASHAVLVQGQITLDALDEEVADQQEAYHRARLEVARLEAPERIVNEAIIRLGMVEPADVVYLTPAEGDSVGNEPSRADVDETWLAIKPYLERSS